MDAIFVYGDKVAEDRDGRYYIGTAFSREIFDRYLEHFEHLTLLVRQASIDPGDTEALRRMNPITDPRIDVCYLPDTTASAQAFIDPRRRRQIVRILDGQIRAGRAVILRMYSVYSYYAARICVKKGIPYLAEAVGCPWDSLTHHSLRGRALAPAAAAQMRYSMRHADYAIYVTRHFLQGRYPTMGVSRAISDVELLPLKEETLEQRLARIRALEGNRGGNAASSGSEVRRLRLGTAGSVEVAYKGQRFVFRALAALKERGICRFEYHLAGGGDDTVLRRLAEELGIEDLIVFEGAMPHEEIYGWLDTLDVYIQPSEQEGLSRALVEAMSRALPCLASDIGGNPELLDPSCIHRCGRTEAIAEALESLTPERMLVMAGRNFEAARAYQKEELQKERRSILGQYAAAVGGTAPLDGVLLRAVAAGLEGRTMEDPGLSPAGWQTVMEMSVEQSLLPLVFEAVYRFLPEETEAAYRSASLAWISRQVQDTEAFLSMYRGLAACGIEPLVIKGIVCRDSYGLPDWRVSSDEDIYVERSDYMRLHENLLRLGFKGSAPNFHSEHETLYTKDGLRIEGHWELFPQENSLWKQMNALTAEIMSRAGYLEIEGTRIRTPEPTDHMIYLLLHAMKHFTLSGVGIRQICDVVQWDRKYAVDWGRVREVITPLGGGRFTAAVLDAGHRYFDMPIPDGWTPADSRDLVRDALEGGVFGHSTEDRLHSGSITFANGAGHHAAHNLLRTLFPSREVMEINYPWVSRSRLLVPAGWAARIFQYMGRVGKGISPLRSIRIGTQRMQLLRKYEVFRAEKDG